VEIDYTVGVWSRIQWFTESSSHVAVPGNLGYHFIMRKQERFRSQNLNLESATWKLPIPRPLRVGQMGRTGESESPTRRRVWWGLGLWSRTHGAAKHEGIHRSDFWTIPMGYTNLALQKFQDPKVARVVVHPHSLHIRSSFYSKSNIFIVNTNLNNL
jgi:hypothetical protein